MSNVRFRFVQDDDGHDYMIPADMFELFNEMEEAAYAGYRNDDYGPGNKFDEMFGKYRTGCHISVYSFTDPKKD